MTKQEIYNILKSTPGVVATSNIQLQTKCFICGDSKKNPYKKRLGIKVDINDPREPIMYNCFNCGAYGVFTPDMLEQLGVENKDLKDSLRKLNKDALSDDGTKINRYKNKSEIQVQFPPLLNNEKTLSKIKYLYNRIGYKIPLEDFEKLKIVFNLKDFLAVNNIEPLNQYVDMLDKDYIGFLSLNNEYVILRDITEKHKMRWVKYNLFDIKDNSNSFYAMRTAVDMLGTDEIHLIIAEGIFDVLSIRYNLFENNVQNKIIMASCNGSFYNPINHFIRKGLVGDNIHIDCYQDNDTKLNFSRMRKAFKPYILSDSNFKVYYNMMGKDFGVPKSKIIIDEVHL